MMSIVNENEYTVTLTKARGPAGVLFFQNKKLVEPLGYLNYPFYSIYTQLVSNSL